jgi:Mg-chelatase subunit ChlD
MRLAMLVLWFVVVVAVSSTMAGDAIPPKPPKVTRTVVVRGHAFPPRIAILIDRSDSMSADGRYARALREARRVVEQAGDEIHVRFACFDEGVLADPQGWYALPDDKRLEASFTFMVSLGTGGGTSIGKAVGFMLDDPTDPLGIVLITDADPNAGDQCVKQDLAYISERNLARPYPAVIGVISIDPGEPNERYGTELSRETGGGYVRLRTVR